MKREASRQVTERFEQPAAGARGAVVVLVLDDNRAVAGSTAMLLGSVGMEVLVATDMTRALQQIAALDRSPDLLVCDYHIGSDGSGIDAIRELRDACAKRQLPAILFSGDTSAPVRRAVKALGSCCLLAKPASGDELLGLCADLLHTAVAGGTVSSSVAASGAPRR